MFEYEPAPNQWHHYSLVHDGENFIWYVDVKKMSTLPMKSFLSNRNDHMIHIGGTNDAGAAAEFDMACVGLFTSDVIQREISDIRRGCDYSKNAAVIRLNCNMK